LEKIASKLRPAKCLLKLKRLQLTKSRSNIIQSHCLVAFFLALVKRTQNGSCALEFLCCGFFCSYYFSQALVNFRKTPSQTGARTWEDKEIKTSELQAQALRQKKLLQN
jgi:hypothetical protein